MKNIKRSILISSALLLFVSPVLAQSLKLQTGSLGFLKGEKALNVEYNYDNLMVGKIPEATYIENKVAEYNKKEAGTGDKWLASWKADRANRYEPKFEELLNKQISGKKIDLNSGKHPEAKYTLVLKTTILEPGWNVGIMRSPAEVSTQAEFFETSDRSKPLALITIAKAPGRDAMGYDFDTGLRLQEGYAKTGKELGAFLYKKGLK